MLNFDQCLPAVIVTLASAAIVLVFILCLVSVFIWLRE